MISNIYDNFAPYTPRVNWTGKQVGKLTILSIHHKNKQGASMWLWKCECGRLGVSVAGNFKSGNSLSCGRKPCRGYHTKHGDCVNNEISREYIAFTSAKSRCTNPRNNRYAEYGGRGIEFRFADFPHFLQELGRKPTPEHSIERKDPNGHYEVGNVCWSTSTEQAVNKTTTRRFDYDGKSLTVCQWAAESGIDHRTLSWRLNHGWSIEKALVTPLRRKSQLSPAL